MNDSRSLPPQAERGTKLAAERGLNNVQFKCASPQRLWLHLQCHLPPF